MPKFHSIYSRRATADRCFFRRQLLCGRKLAQFLSRRGGLLLITSPLKPIDLNGVADWGPLYNVAEAWTNWVREGRRLG